MKFSTNSKSLCEAISVVSKAQQAKNALPILDCVLMQVKDGMLTVACSDTELYTVATLPLAEYDGEFSIAIKSSDLIALKTIADQPVTVECFPHEDGKDYSCTIYYLNGQFTSHAFNGMEFPKPCEPCGEGVQVKKIPLTHMLDGIRHTRFATLQDSTLKPQMAGVYFDMQPYGMVTVASDGNKLAKVWYKDVKTEEPFGFVMINKAVKLLSEIFTKTQGVDDIELVYSGRDFRITTGKYALYGRLPEGAYPNYNYVIPKEYNSKAVISRADMLGVLGRVGIFADDTNEVVLRFEKDNIVIKSVDKLFSRSAKENIACEYDASPFEVALNYHFLSDILSTLAGEDMVVINIVDATHPLTIQPAEADEQQDVLYLLMPLIPQTE